MKDLLIQALNEASVVMEAKIPQTKTEVKYVNIEDVSPLGIAAFMKTNNIPDTAYFGGKPNGDDAYSEICLCYDVAIPTTDKDKLKFRREKFSSIVFKHVFDLLTTKHGYKRTGFDSRALRPFYGESIYDMYIVKNFDRIVEYYSIYFEPPAS